MCKICANANENRLDIDKPVAVDIGHRWIIHIGIAHPPSAQTEVAYVVRVNDGDFSATHVALSLGGAPLFSIRSREALARRS